MAPRKKEGLFYDRLKTHQSPKGQGYASRRGCDTPHATCVIANSAGSFACCFTMLLMLSEDAFCNNSCFSVLLATGQVAGKTAWQRVVDAGVLIRLSVRNLCCWKHVEQISKYAPTPHWEQVV